MAILRVDHPDIIEFVTCKYDTQQLANFNIRWGSPRPSWRRWKWGAEYGLVNPRTGES